jgi:saccharopine dehydrogenase (NAD+, L-lysine-forming)
MQQMSANKNLYFIFHSAGASEKDLAGKPVAFGRITLYLFFNLYQKKYMGKVLVIGAGGVSTVAVKKMAMNADVFTDVRIATRTPAKANKIAAGITNINVRTAQVNADKREELVALFENVRPDLVVNLALPYQDLAIMDACLACGASYLDTANYEPPQEAKYQYSWQWAYKDRFEKAGLTAILGCGFDPGVTGVYTAYAAKHHFDEIQYLDVVDCNAGDHHKAFATNFNPEINIREITQRGKYYENGEWKETDPLSVHLPLNYPGIGPRESYLMYHEELESLVKNFPSLRRARFWMTFGQEYLVHLRVIQNIGMSRIDPVLYNGVEIVPIQFLKAVLPDPGELGENYTGQTSIGCRIRGIKDGKERTCYLYNNCSHEAAYAETGAQAVSYTTGVPAMIGAKLFMQGVWKKPGVWNVEEFNPDPFMKELNEQGLPWQEQFNTDLEL